MTLKPLLRDIAFGSGAEARSIPSFKTAIPRSSQKQQNSSKH